MAHISPQASVGWIASFCWALIAGANCAAGAELTPRVLETTTGPRAVRMRVLDNGQRVHIDWTDEAGVPAGVHIDALSGAVKRHLEPTPTRQFLELDTGHGAERAAQNAIEVMLETVTGDPNWTGPTRLIETATIQTLADLLPGEAALVAARASSGLVIVTGGQNILPESAKTSFTLRLWDSRQPEPRWTFNVPTSRFGGEFASAAVTISPDGRWVTAVRDKALHLLEVATGTARQIERSADSNRGDSAGFGADETAGTIGVGFSQDGKSLYVADGGADISIKRLSDLTEIRRLKAPSQFRVRHIVEYAGGKVLRLEGPRQTMFLDPVSSKFVRRNRGGSTNSYLLAWLGSGSGGQGRILLAARSRRSPIQYRVYTHVAGSFDSKDDRSWPEGAMEAITWSPNGRCLIMSGGGKTAVLATDTLREIATLSVVGDALDTAAFARAGATLFAVDQQKRVLVYDAPASCRSKP